MTTNPLATEDQRDIEAIALRLLRSPTLERARDVATMLWRNAVAWPARDQMDRFDNMIDEYVFHYAMRAANGDAAHPRVARFMAPAHHWFGRDVPGSRWAGDSPDFIYRLIPVEHGGRYEVQGRKTCSLEPTVNYALMGDSNAAPVTQGLLDSLDMEIASDGSFTITIDESPAGERRNHLQTRPGADHILIRDALGDWIDQSANALVVRRIDAAGRAPMDESALAQRAAKNLLEGLYYTYYCTRSGSGQRPNEVRAPLSSGAFGGMATQWGTKGNLDLAPDEAFVVTTTAAGAGFRNVMLTDNFHMSLNYWSRTSSLNMMQMAPDDDGRFTYVVAHRDPGVHNWLDTNGLRETIFGHRWQAFARDAPPEMPTLTAQLVKFDDLDKVLPRGVAEIDPVDRAAQLAKRETGFKMRFLDR
ncbi:MAG: hypothetical protein EOO76_13480 [Novosphingobium sp.]|nr:MAG: hypothetical protein EOO76_13480 [Novosphingobium sp.]